MPARLWTPGVSWQLSDLDALPAVVSLGVAPLDRLLALIRLYGLLGYGPALRDTLSGAMLKRTERALGPRDWARLVRIEAALDDAGPLDRPELADLAELDDPAAVAGLDRRGAATLAACFAACGEAWRLRLGLRLPPALHEAVLEAAAWARPLAQRRLQWGLALLALERGVAGGALGASDRAAERRPPTSRDRSPDNGTAA